MSRHTTQQDQSVPFSGILYECVCVSAAQSCLIFCDPKDCSLLASSVHGILQARILEWVTTPFSRGSSWHRDWSWVSHIAGRFFTIWANREASFIWTVGSYSCSRVDLHKINLEFGEAFSQTMKQKFVNGRKKHTKESWTEIKRLVVAMELVWCCLVAQSCLTLCDPIGYSPSGSSVHGSFRQEYWNGLPCPPPGDLPNLGVEPRSPGS